MNLCYTDEIEGHQPTLNIEHIYIGKQALSDPFVGEMRNVFVKDTSVLDNLASDSIPGVYVESDLRLGSTEQNILYPVTFRNHPSSLLQLNSLNVCTSIFQRIFCYFLLFLFGIADTRCYQLFYSMIFCGKLQCTNPTMPEHNGFERKSSSYDHWQIIYKYSSRASIAPSWSLLSKQTTHKACCSTMQI